MATPELHSALSTIEALRAEVVVLKENVQKQRAELAWWRKQARNSPQQRPVYRTTASSEKHFSAPGFCRPACGDIMCVRAVTSDLCPPLYRPASS
eukprot:2161128-Rhodomonas_salina.2